MSSLVPQLVLLPPVEEQRDEGEKERSSEPATLVLRLPLSMETPMVGREGARDMSGVPGVTNTSA